MASGAPPAAGPPTGKQKSKAYLSSVAIQSDATKYRQKYKELKRKVCEIETVCCSLTQENNKLQVTTLRIKRNIQRLRLERAILYERLEADMRAPPLGETSQSTEQGRGAPKTEEETDEISAELENTM